MSRNISTSFGFAIFVLFCSGQFPDGSTHPADAVVTKPILFNFEKEVTQTSRKFQTNKTLFGKCSARPDIMSHEGKAYAYVCFKHAIVCTHDIPLQATTTRSGSSFHTDQSDRSRPSRKQRLETAMTLIELFTTCSNSSLGHKALADDKRNLCFIHTQHTNFRALPRLLPDTEVSGAPPFQTPVAPGAEAAPVRCCANALHLQTPTKPQSQNGSSSHERSCCNKPDATGAAAGCATRYIIITWLTQEK